MNQIYDEQTNQPTTAVVQIEQERAIQEIKAQVILARHFPRNILKARDMILQECKRPRFADLALYQYPRGKKKNKAGQWVANIVSGPSIRLAEVMARSFTNMKFGIRVMSRRENTSDVQAYAWDMESNVIETRDFIVKHERKSGDNIVKLVDDRDIYEMEANQGARRMRACILAMIPKDVQDEAEDEVNKTMVNNLVGEKGVDRIKKMLEKFADLDIDQVMIEKKFGYKLKSLTLENWAELGRIYNSLKDGIGRADDYFGEQPSGKTDTKKTKEVEEELRKAAEAKKNKKDAETNKTPPPDSEAPETAKGETVTGDQLHKLLKQAAKSKIPDLGDWIQTSWPQTKGMALKDMTVEFYGVIMKALTELEDKDVKADQETKGPDDTGKDQTQTEAFGETNPPVEPSQGPNDLINQRQQKYINEAIGKMNTYFGETGGDHTTLTNILENLGIDKKLSEMTLLEHNKILNHVKDLKKMWADHLKA